MPGHGPSGQKGQRHRPEGSGVQAGREVRTQEFQNPVRTLTATVPTTDERFPLLPVRTSRPVLKVLMKPIMRETAKVRVKPPVKCGDIIVKNVFNPVLEVSPLIMELEGSQLDRLYNIIEVFQTER